MVTFRDNILQINFFMPDNDNSVATQEVKTPTKIGKVERVTMTFPQDQNNNTAGDSDNTNLQNNEGANATNDANNGAANANTNAAPAPTISNESLKEYFKSVGIDFESVDKLKEKLTAPAPTATETPEQIKAKELAKEKRLIDKFISGGSTFDEYTALKSLANADVSELSKNMLRKELQDAKFTDTEIDALIKERYYQLADEELEQLDDETDKEFKKRSKEYFANKLANRSLHIKNQAVGLLERIQKDIDSEDLQAQNEVAFSAKIDEDFQKLPRKLNIEIGDIGGGTIASPVNYDVDEAIVNQVKAELKDPAQRQQLLFNQDGTLNITKIAEAFTKARSFDSMAKISYLEAQTRTNELWQKTFPARSAHELGVGGSQQKPNGQKGAPASFGKSERTTRAPQNA